MKPESVPGLSKEELVELVLVQYEQIVKLQAEVEALRLKLEGKHKPPANSGNSSQPPSRDWKSDLPAKRRKRRHGPPKGHVKYERAWVAQPDHIVDIKPERCGGCQAELDASQAKLVHLHQITELPSAKAEVIEVRQYGVRCGCCGQEQVGQPPAGLERERTFGARLEATVVYYRQEQHMSYVRTQAAMHNLHGVEISQGGIDQIMQRTGNKALAELKPIQHAIQQSAVVHSDETSSRVDGQTWWQWVFGSTKAVLHKINFDRSVDVIREVMAGEQAEVWVSDCYGAQLKAPATQHQLCLAHQVRNLQAVVELLPKQFWARHVQRLFGYAIHLHNQRQHVPPDVLLNRTERIEGYFDQLLSQKLEAPDERRLQRRYQKHRQALFVFLYRPDVSPTNNVSERLLRPAVIHRKVSGGFRSEWGAKTYAALKSLTDTGALSDISPFHVIQNLSGIPALPLPP